MYFLKKIHKGNDVVRPIVRKWQWWLSIKYLVFAMSSTEYYFSIEEAYVHLQGNH